MLIVKSKDLTPLGQLENAYKISYEKHLNELWSASFSLPIDDAKKDLCESFNVIDIVDENDFIGTFRIIPESTSLQNNEIKYQLEHVLATLLDDVLFRYHQRSNFTTTQNVQYILGKQTIPHWVKGEVNFTRYFHYKFENENGLLAPLLSIPKPFDKPYEWTYNTTVYPWQLNLVEPSTEVVGELRWGKNMGSFDEVIDPTKIINRIYPLGAGEGVNQLGIESVNNGVAYLEDAESIAKYGLRSYVWVDKRFEDINTLKANAQGLLDEWKIPKIAINVNSSDLSMLEGYEFEKHRVGNLIRIVVPDREDTVVRIVSESKSDLTGNPQDIVFSLNNKLDDIATTQTDLQRKQQVNDAYSQGATNILNYDYQDNCDEFNPATIKFFLDEDVVNINTCELTFDTDNFRTYLELLTAAGSLVKSTSSGGAVVKSTSSGGGSTATSSSGGGTSTSTSSGGGSTATSSSGGGTSTSTSSGGGSSETTANSGSHKHKMFDFLGKVASSTNDRSVYGASANLAGSAAVSFAAEGGASDIYTNTAEGSHTHSVSVPSHTHGFSTPNHAHDVTIPSHAHGFSTPNHAHDVVIPSHSHSIDIPDHAHDIELPDHTHEVEHGIYKLPTMPTAVEIKVDGNLVPHTSLTGDRLNLEPYLNKVDGRVTRDRHTITIKPNAKGRVNANLILRVFIQSHVGQVI